MNSLRIILLLVAVLLPWNALAQGSPLQLRLERGITEPTPVAVMPFAGAEGGRIAGVVVGNLASTGLFRPVQTDTLAGVVQGLDIPPDLARLRSVSDARALVAGDAGLQPDGRLIVRFRLWDTVTGEQMAGFQYRGDPAAWRRMAHRVTDAIYERLVGEPGYFETRIAFIAETGPKNKRLKRLAVMDYDGENVEYLTNGDELVLTPRFSPTEEAITYISYRNGQPRIHLMNVETRRGEVLGRFPGMTFAPRFSPDGRAVMMSLSADGGTDIYEMDLATRRLRRLTRSAGIDTSPSYSPKGDRIVFESDRGGGQQLYVMDRDGGNARRISFGQGRYATPVWSPRGDFIAFTRIADGKFSIGIMAPDGSRERILTSSFLDEGPTWSPNGRRLMFYRETPGAGGAPRVYEISVAGGRPRPVRTPAGASDPSWGPVRR